MVDNQIRSLTIAEAKALASYPGEFVFEGSKSKQWARIGNSVPPLFMRAIALHLRTLLENGLIPTVALPFSAIE